MPRATACDTTLVPLDYEGLPRPVAVSMGNPHAVFLVPDVEALDVARLGAALERHPIFPERANIGFAQVPGPSTIRRLLFARGAGLTLACGRGACAARVAAVRRGLASSPAILILDGGSLEIAWSGEGAVLMTGPTALGFEGVLEGELLGA
jgi:diaminopimelate epimerase